jgi:hypothetical protein
LEWSVSARPADLFHHEGTKKYKTKGTEMDYFVSLVFAFLRAFVVKKTAARQG